MAQHDEGTGQDPEQEDGGREPERREPNDSDQPTDDVHLRSTFHRSVDEGVARLGRTRSGLLATGLVGGLDVSLGVLALLVLLEATGSIVVGALGFSIGFIALTLGKSELFTENFMVPVAALTADRASVRSLLRLWAGTLVTNLIGGWLFAWLIVWGLPSVHDPAVALGRRFAELGTGEAVALGVIAGASITLMTWMEHGAKSDFSRVTAVIAIAFLLAAAHLNHVIVVSVEMFVALHTGAADFGYAAWARVAGIATITNMLGGLLLVTVLRLIQVGRPEIDAEREIGSGRSRPGGS